MNTKNVLIAALIAAATSSAFAAEFAATAGNPEVQIAQVQSRAEVRADTKRAIADGTIPSWKDSAPTSVTGKTDGRTRAEARAQAAAYNMSAEAREARLLYLGGQQ